MEILFYWYKYFTCAPIIIPFWGGVLYYYYFIFSNQLCCVSLGWYRQAAGAADSSSIEAQPGRLLLHHSHAHRGKNSGHHNALTFLYS